MNQDIEHLLNQVTPRALPPELRQRVLAAVDEELNRLAQFGECEPPGEPIRNTARWEPRTPRITKCHLGASAPSLPVPTPSRRRWRFRPGLAAAAALLGSLLLNHVVNRALDRRLAAVLGPRPVPRQAAEIAADIAALTDPQTGKWAFDRLVSHRGEEGDTERYLLRLQQIIEQLTAETQETLHETTQENHEMDGDRRGNLDRNPPSAQRVLRLEYGNRA